MAISQLLKNQKFYDQEKFEGSNSSSESPNIQEKDGKLKLIMSGLAGFLFVITGLTALCVGVYQLTIRWKLNIDTSKFEFNLVLIILIFFIGQLLFIGINTVRKKATAAQYIKVGISPIFIMTLMVSIFPPGFINRFYYGLFNLIFGLSFTIVGLYFHHRSKGLFSRMLKDLSSQKTDDTSQ